MPLAAFDDAFKPQHRFALLELVQGERKPWAIDFPDLPDLGGGATAWASGNRLIGWLGGHVRKVQPLAAQPLAPFHTSAAAGDRARLALVLGTPDLLPTHNVQHLADGLSAGIRSLSRGDPMSSVIADALSLGSLLLANTTFAFLKAPLPADDFSRRLWICSTSASPSRAGCLTTGSTSAASTPSKGSRCAHGSRSIRPSPEAATRRRRTGSHSNPPTCRRSTTRPSRTWMATRMSPMSPQALRYAACCASCSITKGRSFSRCRRAWATRSSRR